MAPRRPVPKNPKAKASSRPKKRTEEPSPSARQLLLDAKAAYTVGDRETAKKLASRAVDTLDGESAVAVSSPSIDPSFNNPVDLPTPNPKSSNPYTGAAHTLLGTLILETDGDPDAARPFFLAATAADPEDALPEDQSGGADKYLYLAQLSEEGGTDSIILFERGANALRKQIRRLQEAEERAVARRKQVTEVNEAPGQIEGLAEARHTLAEVLCGMAEVYMTDLSFENDAEAKCDQYIFEAVSLIDTGDNDGTSIQHSAAATVWQTVASVRISQNRGEDAQLALERSMAVWEGLPPMDPRMPDFAVLISLVRLLLTVSMFEKAAETASMLRDQNEEAVEVWYLGGYALYLIGEGLRDSGEMEQYKQYWLRARQWLRGCLKVFASQEYEDERLHDHAVELLKAVVDEVGEPDGSEDEWEDDTWEGIEDEDGDENMEL